MSHHNYLQIDRMSWKEEMIEELNPIRGRCPANSLGAGGVESTPRLKGLKPLFVKKTFTLFFHGIFLIYMRSYNPKFEPSSFKTLGVTMISKIVIFQRFCNFWYRSIILLFKNMGSCPSRSCQNLTETGRML